MDLEAGTVSEATIITETEPMDQPKAALRRTRDRGVTEKDLRDKVEAWGRARWPEARVCHELVMNRGTVRLDVAFVSPRHLAVVELKSGYDTMERVMHQVGWARLCAHEVWLVCDQRWGEDMRILRYLLPSLGIAHAKTRHHGPDHQAEPIEILAESAWGEPHPLAMASLLWVAELAAALGRGGANPGNHRLLSSRLALMAARQRDEMVCQQLRGRDALWRADPPIRDRPAPLPIGAA